MKHLKGYKLFESNINESTINESTINDIKDILIEFNDKGVKLEVEVLNSNKIIVMIGEEESSNYIKFKEYKETLNHFLLYIKEVGLSISNAYLKNDTWDAEIICPECSSLSVDIYDDEGVCNSCNNKFDSFEFYSDEHPLDLGDFTYYINNNYWCQFLFIELTKS